MVFLVSSGKMIFFSTKIWYYSLGGKWKMIFLKIKNQKNMEIPYILQIFRKDALSKEFALEYDLSNTMRKDGISFSRKYDIFFTDGKWKMIFLKKYMEIWCFLYVGKGGIYFSYKYEITLLSKKKRWSFRKNTPKDDISGIIEKDDIHPRKDDLGILCTFTETFLSVFIYCFPIKKPRKLNL